jgi:general secretion pathway protein I
MKPCLKDDRGFSLLEILIAVGILATAMVTLMGAQGSAFLSSARSESLTTAVMLARARMAEVEIEIEKDMEKNKFPDESETNGEFEEPFGDYQWRVSITKVEIPVMEAGGEAGALVGDYMQKIMEQISKSVREVKLTIFWGEREAKEEDRQQFSVTTHIVKMTP